jgi:DNA-directed RNA polymerase subunit L
MKFTILKMSNTEIELSLDEKDTTLTELIAEKLNQYDNVEFAAAKIEHPLIDSPKLYLKVNKGDALKTLKKCLEDIKKEIKEIRDAI